MIHRLRRALWAGTGIPGTPFERQRSACRRAWALVRAFYCLLLLFASSALSEAGDIDFVIDGARARLWPVLWTRWTGVAAARRGLGALFFAGALAAALWPGRRWARALAALGIFEYVALMCTFGHIFPSMHHWVLAALLFAMAPSVEDFDSASRVDRQCLLLVFWTCQAMLLLTYTMAGLSKILVGLYQAWLGQAGAFSSMGMPNLIAAYGVESGTRSLLGPWLVGHPGAAALAHWTVILGQSASIAAAFRPRLHRAWGCLLILFHAATFLALGIIFRESVALLALLLLQSPFSGGGSGEFGILGGRRFGRGSVR